MFITTFDDNRFQKILIFACSKRIRLRNASRINLTSLLKIHSTYTCTKLLNQYLLNYLCSVEYDEYIFNQKRWKTKCFASNGKNPRDGVPSLWSSIVDLVKFKGKHTSYTEGCSRIVAQCICYTPTPKKFFLGNGKIVYNTGPCRAKISE